MNTKSFVLRAALPALAGFALHDMELVWTRFTITVHPGWTKVLVNGRR